MNRLTLFFLCAALVATASSHDHDEDFDEEEVHHHHPPNVAPAPLPSSLKDYALSLLRAPAWTFIPGPMGPSNWYKKWPKCGQQLQSPINIEHGKVIQSHLKPLYFHGWDVPLNNVHLMNVFRFGIVDTCDIAPRATIQGGPLPGKVPYYFHGLYFTVGKNKTHGSVHQVNNKSAPFEIGFMFHSSNNATLSQHHYGSSVVLHFLGKIVPEDNPNFLPITDGFKKIIKGGQEARCNIASLKSLFPAAGTWEKKYYTYTGSSFVPPCQEGFIRIVYKRSINLSLKQFKALQGLYNERNQYIWNNYRPIQPNTYMQVLSSFKFGKRPVPNVITTTTTAHY